MADRIFGDARLKKLALGQERLANTMAQLIHTIQNPNGGRSSSKEVDNSQSSKVDNIATWYEEYRALPKKIRDAMSFSEFMGISKGRSRPKPRSQTTQEEKLGLQISSMKISQFDEGLKHEPREIMEHVSQGKSSLIFNDISLVSNGCLWQIVEKKSDLHKGKEDDITEGYVHGGKALPVPHDYFQFAGNFQTAVTKEQIDEGIHKEQSQFRHHPKKGKNPLMFYDSLLNSNGHTGQPHKEVKSDLLRTYEDDIMRERRAPLRYFLSVVPNSKF
ncbi:hypothetical protein KI387_040669 [Taxus chinensis]|uniref:Uncharacterized protein n=1 Tax=Taxus chinensis TaxID=29808 RepID=A0AA38CBL8_TAXCH|nr:hypothetical protein KI387_040669 [Taxus chinensis]